MLRILAPLTLFLGFIGIGDAQYNNCDYRQSVRTGQKFSINSPNYPNSNYAPGSNCRWVFQGESTLKMNCTINIPQSNKCDLDALSVKSDDDPARRYCGSGGLNVASDENNQIIITINSARSSRGGQFLCDIVADAGNECQCGWQNPSRIVGGKETGVNEYPMVAGLVHRQRGEIICGATIINNLQVVTAAHCLYGQSTSGFLVVVGEHNTDTANESSATRVYKIRQLVTHPNYDPRREINDIAIITIDGVIEFNQFVGPVCLPFQHYRDSFAGALVSLLGWGTTGFASAPSSVLQSTEVSVVTNKDCSNSFPQVQNTQMCTYARNRDSCQMDSGGPVLWKNPSTKRLVLVGIISSGTDCGGASPGVNTRVGSFMDFIWDQRPQRGYEYCEAE
ncbi:venom serine protease 34-like isoform X1 [Aphidius gifuensis]|uniref:venom serine protease 34-like isoform X1 n=1 Tax=Aphidius gifuensis TaxID=684658 RepID=UPI001CDCF9C8|nr:venom serine protease 34-like isoform X1 [Aphidius gifuensis]